MWKEEKTYCREEECCTSRSWSLPHEGSNSQKHFYFFQNQMKACSCIACEVKKEYTCLLGGNWRDLKDCEQKRRKGTTEEGGTKEKGELTGNALMNFSVTPCCPLSSSLQLRQTGLLRPVRHAGPCLPSPEGVNFHHSEEHLKCLPIVRGQQKSTCQR